MKLTHALVPGVLLLLACSGIFGEDKEEEAPPPPPAPAKPTPVKPAPAATAPGEEKKAEAQGEEKDQGEEKAEAQGEEKDQGEEKAEEKQEVVWEKADLEFQMKLPAGMKDEFQEQAEKRALRRAKAKGYEKVEKVRVSRKKCDERRCEAVVKAVMLRSRTVEKKEEGGSTE